MDKRTAQRLAERIERDVSTVRVNGIAMYSDTHTYSLSCTDTVSGYPFWVRSVEDWEDRWDAMQQALKDRSRPEEYGRWPGRAGWVGNDY